MPSATALTSDGRTLAQGALAWIWARSPAAIPIPGFRSVAQVEENIAALTFGPLPAGAYVEVIPPSTGSVTPVTYPPASLARKTSAAASSSGSPLRLTSSRRSRIPSR